MTPFLIDKLSGSENAIIYTRVPSSQQSFVVSVDFADPGECEAGSGNTASARPMVGDGTERATMSTRIGFDHYTIAHRGFTAAQTLEFAQAHHFDGVQFLEPASIDPKLDPQRLTAFRNQAAVMGLYLEVGLPSPNPVRRSRELGRRVDPVGAGS